MISTKSFYIFHAVAGELAIENRSSLGRFPARAFLPAGNLLNFGERLFIVQKKRFQNASTGLPGQKRH